MIERCYILFRARQRYDERPLPPAAPKGSLWTRLGAGKPSGARAAPADIVFPKTVEEAVALYAAGDSALVCGGTSHALRRERSGYPFAPRLVALKGIPALHALETGADGALTMGAMVHQQALYDHPEIRAWHAIGDALDGVGHTRIRRMLTVGGSIGPLIGGFDLPLALLVLGARVTVQGPEGRRTVALDEAFESRFGKHEIVLSATVDPVPARSGTSFFKYMARGTLEIPTVNTAAAVTLNPDGTCADALIAVGAVSWKPIVLRLPQLAGRRLGDEIVRSAVAPVRDLAQPMSDVRGSAHYKRLMAVEFAVRAVLKAAQRTGVNG